LNPYFETVKISMKIIEGYLRIPLLFYLTGPYGRTAIMQDNGGNTLLNSLS
jgi:hypothetical protein